MQSEFRPICVILTTHNNASVIDNLVAALLDYPSVLVVDSGSMDGTVQLAEAAGWTVVHREYAFASDQLNWALDMAAPGSWCLILDSDETPRFTMQALQREIGLAERGGQTAIALRRRNQVWGKWIRHGGWYPDLQVRVVQQRASLRYEPVPVHAHVMVDRSRLRISELELDHQTYLSVDDYWRRLLRHTGREATIDYRKSSHSYRPRGGRLKIISRLIPARVPVHFFYRYVVRMGFLDGWRGWHLALWSAVYQDVLGAKRRYGDGPTSEGGDQPG